MFVTRGSMLTGALKNLRYVVVDELHAFIGSERGMQLQSLMHRVDKVRDACVPRVGLSATLGDMELAAAFLRPRAARPVEVIESDNARQDIRILVKGIVQKPPRVDEEPELESPSLEDIVPGSTVDIANQLYKALRGSNNLIFPNSRRQVELYADLLRRACERDGYPNEFWPHHGSLSKDLREESEAALKAGDKPASAVCTTTLELGIDIGAVRSIAQIGPPPSVASLRQRLGRSGRRAGEAAILRGYCVEAELDADSNFSDRIREGLVQTIAMVNLLIERWFEPPRADGFHPSTLAQQILSIIAERGGATAADLWGTLVATGPFVSVDKNTFAAILRELGRHDLVVQESSGLLLHGVRGEKIVNHYEFYASFVTDDEFRIVAGSRQLGSLPVSHPLTAGQGIIFGGQRWRVRDVDAEKKVAYVDPDKGGAPPAFDCAGIMVHDIVRQAMYRVLESSEPVGFLDPGGRKLLDEAREYFHAAHLAARALFTEGHDVIVATWSGDWVNDALVLLLRSLNLDAWHQGVAVGVRGTTVDRVTDALNEIAETKAEHFGAALDLIENIDNEKWDWALPEGTRRAAFAASRLDLWGAVKVAERILQK
jgi:ATP-dependent helicase Lhr and Lhr-like helicase